MGQPQVRSKSSPLDISIDTDPQQKQVAAAWRLLRAGCLNVEFYLALKYFVDTIKHAHMGRTKAQAEHQESRA